MTLVSSVKASLESADDPSPPVTGPSYARPSWFADTQEHANLSPIVKNGSLRRQHGHVRLAALRQLARHGAIRIPPAEAGRRHSSLPREVLDRSLPPVPPTTVEPATSGHFAVKRKSVPTERRRLPPTPELPSWVKQSIASPQPGATSAPPTPVAVVATSGLLPIPSPSPNKAAATLPLSLVRSPRTVASEPAVRRMEVTAACDAQVEMLGRLRLIPGARVKEAVEKIEHIASTSSTSALSTPVRAIGAIVERPCTVSSSGLSSEARRIMAEARLQRLSRKA